jgi:3-deoxy-alpha-D-manno-octulosonate 8-oxidase
MIKTKSEFRIFKQVPRLIFGSGSLKRINELLPDAGNFGYMVFVVDDIFKEKLSLLDFLDNKNHEMVWFPASLKEPSTKQVDDIRDGILANERGLPSVIIGIGGGSTMDVAKSVSVMLTNEGSSSDYQGWDLLNNPGIYKIGVPTISGSGAEASRTAVLMGKERKFGINDDYSMFDAIILDSTLISDVPKEQRFYSGMDCYIHCVESLNGTMLHELSRGYASKALELCENVFFDNGSDDELMTASYMGGVSIVNSEVGVCHALSYGLSIELGYRHGFANCVAFKALGEFYGPWVEKFNRMLIDHSIKLPENICEDLNDEAMQRMVSMTLKMERPLANALGENWRENITEEKIIELYKKM